MTEAPIWVPLLSVSIGALWGFGVAEARDLIHRRRQRRGNFEALGVELQMCGDLASGYLRDKVMAPAYRMPLMAYEHSLPALLVDGVLSVAETNALLRFYVNAMAFNFSVDQVQAVLMMKEDSRPPMRLEHETNRVRLKAGKLCRGSQPANHFDAAVAVIRRHLPKEARARLLIQSPADLAEPNEEP